MPRFKLLRPIGLVALALAAACGGGDDGGTPGGPDAPVGGGIDCDCLDDAIVGTWQQLPAPGDDPADRQTLTFAADQGYSATRPGLPATITGTWAIEEPVLTVDAMLDGEHHVDASTYVVAGDTLAIHALIPAGPVDGLVGMWHGTYQLDAVMQVVDVDVRADGTIHYAQTGHEAHERDGTWEDVGGQLVATFPLGPTESVVTAFNYINGTALGEYLFARQP